MKVRLLIGVVPVLLLVACGGDDSSSSSSTEAPSTEAACRASFQTYSDELAADAMVAEEPLQAATVNACGSSDEWIEVAEEFQGPDPSDLFPPNPIGGLENVLSLFCEPSPDAPACS